MKKLLIILTAFCWNCAFSQTNNSDYQVCIDAIKASASVQKIKMDVVNDQTISQAIKTLESKTTNLWGSGKATSVILAGGVPIPVTSQGAGGFSKETKSQLESYFTQSSHYSMKLDVDFYFPPANSLDWMSGCIDKVSGNSNLLISSNTIEGEVISFSIRTKTPDVKIEVKNIILTNADLITPPKEPNKPLKIILTYQPTLFKLNWLDTSKAITGDIEFKSIDAVKHIHITPEEKILYKATVIDTIIPMDGVVYIQQAGIKIAANYEDKGTFYVNLSGTTDDGSIGNCPTTMHTPSELKNNYYFLSSKNGRNFMTYFLSADIHQVKIRVDEVVNPTTTRTLVNCK